MKRSHVNPSETAASATSTDLLRQAQANDQDAWEQLVRLYSRRMYRWCRRAGLQPADSSNVVQEAIRAVARKLGQFRRDRPGDTFRGWLRRITDNKIKDHYRRLGRSVDVAVGGSDAQQRLAQLAYKRPLDPTQDIESNEAFNDGASWDTSHADRRTSQLDILEKAIELVRSKVSARNWRIFWRVVVDGQPAPDVAQEFSMTANAVRLVKMRVLRRLRSCLEKEGGEPSHK